jgi:hypothetical protein
MKTFDPLERTADPVISEVRAIKRQIVAEHGGDLDSFFASIRQRQSRNPRLVKTTGGEQEGVGEQPPIIPPSAPLPLSNGGGATT